MRPQHQTEPPPTGSSRLPKPPIQHVPEDHSKEVASSDAGLHSSQHLESQIQPNRNPFRFTQTLKRSKASFAVPGNPSLPFRRRPARRPASPRNATLPPPA